MQDRRRLRVMVTGGNGYVGRLVTRMLYPDHQVWVVDCLRGGTLRFAPDEQDRFRLERVDITDAPTLSSLMRAVEPDVIIHLAAIHYIPECEQEPGLAVRTNVDGTVNLLTAAPPGCRFVYASSGAVYRPDPEPHSELHAALGPTDVYGLSKLHGEQYVQYFAQQRAFSAAIVRLFNVVGPGETNPHLLPEIMAQLQVGRRRIRLGNLSPKRDYIHVEDAARGFVAAGLDGTIPLGEAIAVNLGTARCYSVREVVSALSRICGMEIAIDQDEARMRRVDRPVLAADIERMQRHFGWRPRFSLEDALTHLWKAPDLAEELVAKYR